MIFEIVFGVILVVAVVIIIRDYLRTKILDFSPLVSTFLAGLIILAVSFLSALIVTLEPGSINNIEPIEKCSLKEIDGSYILHSSNGNYTFKFGNDIMTVPKSTCFIIDSYATNIDSPIVFKCKLRHSLWIIKLINIFPPKNSYVFIIPAEDTSIRNYYEELPEWLTSL